MWAYLDKVGLKLHGRVVQVVGKLREFNSVAFEGVAAVEGQFCEALLELLTN